MQKVLLLTQERIMVMFTALFFKLFLIVVCKNLRFTFNLTPYIQIPAPENIFTSVLVLERLRPI